MGFKRGLVAAFLMFPVCAALFACAAGEQRRSPPSLAMKPIEQVQREHEADWLALPGVEGVGVAECDGKPCLKVFISAPDTSHAGIPSEADGYPVQIEVTGPFRALENPGN
jgi:hypothetical protein